MLINVYPLPPDPYFSYHILDLVKCSSIIQAIVALVSRECDITTAVYCDDDTVLAGRKWLFTP